MVSLEKSKKGDEFLIKKKNPLVVPPDFDLVSLDNFSEKLENINDDLVNTRH